MVKNNNCISVMSSDRYFSSFGVQGDKVYDEIVLCMHVAVAVHTSCYIFSSIVND